jgi:phytoene synthase
LLALKPSPELAAVAREIAQRALAHLDEARRLRGAIPRAALPVLLHGVVVERRQRRLAALDHNVMNPDFAREDTLQIMRLALAAWRGRF